MLTTLLKGFTASGSLIIAIGAQNAFVIRQGLKCEFLLLTALLCSFIDALLIICGVAGFGNFISNLPVLMDIMISFAVIFLFAYGLFSFISAFKVRALNVSEKENGLASAKKIIVSLLALSLLNPHVYLDTVILLGSIASQHSVQEKVYFTFGATFASFVWFFAITYGARFLAPFFQKTISWRIIDILTGLTMWGIAYTLL